MPKIVILDGYTENPGDLSWEAFEKLGELAVYDRSSADQIIPASATQKLFIQTKPLFRAPH